MVTGCATNSTGIATPSTQSIPAAGSNATDSVAVENPDAGTFVGNGKPRTLITLQTATEEQDSDPEFTSYSDELPHCELKSRKGKNEQRTQALRCRFTSSDYQFRITDIQLITCSDMNRNPVACEPGLANMAVTSAVSIYSASPVVMALSATPTAFPGEIILPETPFTATGLLIKTSFVAQKFPSATAADAARVSADLHAKGFLVCLADEQADATNSGDACGNAQARRGDLLFDLDSDGDYGYLDAMALHAGEIVELPDRPKNYVYDKRQRSEKQMEHLNNLIVTLPETQSLSAQTGLNLALTFYVSDMTSFIDGHPWPVVTGVEPDLSFINGVFDPREDFGLDPHLPSINATFEE